MGQVIPRLFSNWADVFATMPGFGNERVEEILKGLEEVGIGATNGKIGDIESGFIVPEGFDWTDIAR